MRLILDELWPKEIAVQLRQRGFDVVGANEIEQAGRYAAIDDSLLFQRAQEDGRAVVTDNVSDFELGRLRWADRGKPHYGVIYALDPPFNRHRSEVVIERMVLALEHLLRSESELAEPSDRVYWLAPAPASE